jgi:hypothetical protein
MSVMRDVVHLDVLTRRHVALAQRHIPVDDAGERVQLIGGHSAHRELDADHLHVGLTLAVDALLQAELDEIGLLQVAAQVARRFGVEVVELTLEDRDHVPGHVLDHLRILARSGARGGLGHQGSFRWRESTAPKLPKADPNKPYLIGGD